MTFSELAARVRSELAQDHRYAHCVRVARMAENLARAHRADPHKARIAGMLHDLARLYSSEKLLAESAARGLPVDAYAQSHPIVLHAPLSAHLAREHFGVDDPAVLSAIAKHTLADAVMSPLDCILYLADSLEPGRTFEGRADLADLAARDLFAAMYATIESSLRYLKHNRIAPAPQTAAAMAAFGPRPASLEVGTAGHS
ncbi:MAG: bis(5'-nucleosyl)-tetraphosphatase (symmetrical) YqeK [Candidatus Baltobacteraceae bacterium]